MTTGLTPAQIEGGRRMKRTMRKGRKVTKKSRTMRKGRKVAKKTRKTRKTKKGGFIAKAMLPLSLFMLNRRLGKRLTKRIKGKK
jgi:phage tail tape-measure protein